ncbi:hypothetical protein chiPu_0033845 [Chiloscyllium punctatum]|uniref:Uncharacterized protein n=1 Tax=Chiloscyllium punctatum TaxID=137246 RepID=A0A401U4I5_CHIPU|nr:hypothetical protein [Chiloscyllium punctatum]
MGHRGTGHHPSCRLGRSRAAPPWSGVTWRAVQPGLPSRALSDRNQGQPTGQQVCWAPVPRLAPDSGLPECRPQWVGSAASRCQGSAYEF